MPNKSKHDALNATRWFPVRKSCIDGIPASEFVASWQGGVSEEDCRNIVEAAEKERPEVYKDYPVVRIAEFELLEIVK